MDKFTDIIRQDNIDEAYSKSMGYNKANDAIYRLEAYLAPSSILAKSISKELGKGYLKDFAEMQKHMDEIVEIWQEMKRDIELQD